MAFFPVFLCMVDVYDYCPIYVLYDYCCRYGLNDFEYEHQCQGTTESSKSSSSCPGVPTGRCYGWTGYPALSYMLYPAGYSRLPVSALEVNRVGEKPFTVILKYTFIILILRQKCSFLVKSFFQQDIRP